MKKKKVCLELVDGQIYEVSGRGKAKQTKLLSESEMFGLLQHSKGFCDRLTIEITDEINIVQTKAGVTSVKPIEPDSLLQLIKMSKEDYYHVRAGGRLPTNTVDLAFTVPGDIKKIAVFFPSKFYNMKTIDREYIDMPFPSMIFIFKLENERIVGTHIGCVQVDDIKNLDSATKIYHYPYVHVSDFSVCWGNALPAITSLHQLDNVPLLFLQSHHVIGHYTGENTYRYPMEMLLEKMEKKEHSLKEILVDSGLTLDGFLEKYLK